MSDASSTARPRLVRPNRHQLFLQPTYLEDLLPPDHVARVIWAAVEELDMSGFIAAVQSVEGHEGRPATDPRVLLAVWLYAISQGVGSARAVARLCEAHDGYRWLLGGVSVNYHTLSDFRHSHGEALNDLFTDVLAALLSEGVVTLNKVAQDGIKVRASAGSGSFHRERTLLAWRDAAEAEVKRLERDLDRPDNPPSARKKAAAVRAARDRQQRVKKALEELPKVRAVQDKKAPEEVRVSTTDPDARVMIMADNGFRPAFNGQFATDCDSQIIVGVGVTTHGIDKAQLPPMLDQIERRFGRLPTNILADGGYSSAPAITSVTQRGVTVYAPPQYSKNPNRGRYQPTQHDSPEVAAWRQRMGTPEAADLYKQRASTAECVNALARFRSLTRFFVRGLDKVRCVLLLVALVHNILRRRSLAATVAA